MNHVEAQFSNGLELSVKLFFIKESEESACNKCYRVA